MSLFEEHFVIYGDDNKQIFYLATGPSSGPLLIFLHGWPGIGKTWHAQLITLASLGFRVLAPDMPGYGRSTARKVSSDYAQERIVEGMLALLAHTTRSDAIWIGHDWGCATVWTLAAMHPHMCRAVAALSVPYRNLELGLEELLKVCINRDLYPEDVYPFGQWSYQAFYEHDFERASGFMDADPAGFLKAVMQKPGPRVAGKPTPFSTTMSDGGFFGGMEKPPRPSEIPDGNLAIDPEVFDALVAAMEKTGFAPGDMWYMNHEANRRHTLTNAKNGGKLEMPVLFIHGRHDPVCDTLDTRATESMRKLCSNLTETAIDGGHWFLSEKPVETTAALTRWLVEEVKDWWPGYWRTGFVKRPVG